MTRYVSRDNWQPSDGVKLTPEQQAAVLINDRNIAIVAGPGTGKTEVLAQKATYLLQTGLCLSPFRILALCYKVDAASNIRERVKKRCPKDLSSRFCSLTVDSFIISLVRRFVTSLPSWLKIQTDFEIVDEIDLVNYCRSANTTVFPNQYTKDVTILQGDVSKATKDIYLYAARNNFFDYNMCHTLAYYIINNNQNIKKLISKTYKYIFLDEFQDMNVRHYDILKCLFNNQYNKICAVGDFNQAIMGWAGAVPDIFNKFQNDFSSTQHLFTYNHRSTPTIVEFINKVICKLTPSGQQIIKYSCSNTSQVTNSFIAAYGTYTVEDEATYIACCIKTILAENINLHPNDIAIILKQKTSDYLSTTSQIFTQYSICVRNEDEKVCKNGLRFQDLMVDSFSKLIIYLLKSKLKIITITEQKELFSLLADILSLDIGRNNNIKKIHNKINEIHEIDFDNIQEWLSQILLILPKKKIRYKFYTNQKDFNAAILSVPALLQKCVENANGNLQLAIDEYLGVNFVKLMTTHKSKGLEFDTVFFADFRTNSWWTLSRSQTDKDEALRCFFVGLSRAKTRLFFTSPVNSYPQDIADILNDSQMVVNYTPNT